MTSSSSLSSIISSDIESCRSDEDRTFNDDIKDRDRMIKKEFKEFENPETLHGHNFQEKQEKNTKEEKAPIEGASLKSDSQPTSLSDDSNQPYQSLEKNVEKQETNNENEKEKRVPQKNFSINVKHQMLSSTSTSSLSSVGSFFSSDEQFEEEKNSNDDRSVIEADQPIHNEIRDDKKTLRGNPRKGSDQEDTMSLLKLVTEETDASTEADVDVVQNGKTEKNVGPRPLSLSSEVSDVSDKDLLPNDNFETAQETLVSELKQEKIIKKPIRPKTAKPPHKNRQHTKLQKPEQIRTISKSDSNSSSSTTFSSDTVPERKNDVKSQRSLKDLEQRTRERFLHRCLADHLSSQLSQHRAYFDLSSPHRKNRRCRRRFHATPPRVSRQRTSSASARRHHEAILPAFCSQVREEDVKRNIEMLIAELARHESIKSLMNSLNPLSDVNSFQNEDDRRKKIKKNKTERSEHNSTSSADSTATRSLSSSPNNSIDNAEGGFKNSILKKPNQRTHQQKRVRLVEERFRPKNKQPKTRGENVRAHLTALLSAIGPADYIMTDSFGQLHHVTLRHTPIHLKQSSFGARPASTRGKRPRRKQKKVQSFSQNFQEDVEKEENEQEEKTRLHIPKVAFKDAEHQTPDEEKVTSRIRPGTEAIKCNWNPGNLKSTKPELKFSDHQLKSSSNPAVLEWLARKNALHRANRIRKFRENRSKRDRLMQEQNEKEDKQANALVEYEKWKKKKNREMLLRRRKEVLLSSASTHNVKSSTCQQKNGAMDFSKAQDSSITTFSDLRSSAISPHPPRQMPPSSFVTGGARQRPKSAPIKPSLSYPNTMHDSHHPPTFVPVRIDLENGDVTIASPRQNYGGTNPSKSVASARNRGKEPKRSFMRELIEEPAVPVSMFDIFPQKVNKKDFAGRETNSEKVDNDSLAKSNLDKDHYNNWVRSKGLSSPYQIKLNKPKKTKKSLAAPHDPLTNEIISDLAKRRIKKILDQKKRVDSGLSRNQQPTQNKMAANVNPEVTKWKLRDEMSVNLNLENVSKKRSHKADGNKRPTFSYNKKTKSKSVFHERNPILNQALNT